MGKIKREMMEAMWGVVLTTIYTLSCCWLIYFIGAGIAHYSREMAVVTGLVLLCAFVAIWFVYVNYELERRRKRID